MFSEFFFFGKHPLEKYTIVTRDFINMPYIFSYTVILAFNTANIIFKIRLRKRKNSVKVWSFAKGKGSEKLKYQISFI